jgi:hypothetical protein
MGPDWSLFKPVSKPRRRGTWVDYVLFYVLAAGVAAVCAAVLGIRAGLGTRRRIFLSNPDGWASLHEFQYSLLAFIVMCVLLAWGVLTVYLVVFVRRDRAFERNIQKRLEEGEMRRQADLDILLSPQLDSPSEAKEKGRDAGGEPVVSGSGRKADGPIDR